METRDIETRLRQIRDLLEIGAVQFNYEAILETHYRKWLRPGDVAMDIGAHIGRHLLPMSQCVGATGKVYGFEPLPFAFAILQQKFPGPTVVLENLAMSSQIGTASFTYARGTPEESGLRQREYNLPDQADPTLIEVKVDTLDHYAADIAALSFLKIDIEGGEIDCLKGGVATLRRLRPLVSVEFGRSAYSAYGHQSDALFNFAQANDYLLYDIFLNPLRTLADWSIACDSIYWDYLMVPTEKEAEFISRVRQPVSSADSSAPVAAPGNPSDPAAGGDSAVPWSIGRVWRGIQRRVLPKAGG